MSPARWLGAVLLAGLLVAAAAGPALAHPLGNFTTNTYAGVAVAPEEIRVDYVLDLAEIPAFRKLQELGGEREGLAADTYRTEQCAEIARGLDVRVDGEPVETTVADSALTYPPGQAGLSTLRLECGLTAEADALADGAVIEVEDDNFRERVGWREITAVGDRMTLVEADVPAETISDRLRSYPQDRLQSPLDARSARLVVESGGSVLPALGGGSDADGGLFVRGLSLIDEAFTGLIGDRDLTLGFGALAGGLAIMLGAAHALAPGHGKTVMAAYLVGSRSSTRQAMGLGLTVASTHTLGVFILGLVLSGTQTLAPARLYPWLGLASGVLFASVGAVLLRRALRQRRQGHAHGHGHEHAHAHGHDHDHGEARGPSAGQAGNGWRSLVAPGLAGGMVPSPSALVVLLGGIALGRAWFGATLVVAYGVGMALTLFGTGYALMRARSRLEARAARRAADPAMANTGRLARVLAALPVATAGLIVVGGVAIAARAATAF